MREREPKLSGNEIALYLKLSVPDQLFQRPTIQANINVPIESVGKITITPEMTTNIEKIVKEVVGLEVGVSLAPHPSAAPDSDKE